MKKLFVIFSVLATLCLSACSNTSNTEFLGKWEQTTNTGFGKQTIEVKDNQGSVIVVWTYIKGNGALDPLTFTGSTKNGILTVNQYSSAVTFTIDKSNGLLLGNGSSYKKFK